MTSMRWPSSPKFRNFMLPYAAFAQFRKYRRVGLLGGSFNPPHAGHVHISRVAQRAARLDAVLWLVSPQNPLKKQYQASLPDRLSYCNTLLVYEKNILATDVEAALHIRFTIDTLATLRQHLPHTELFWVMGADNLAQFHRWKRWKDIAATCPILVCDRTLDVPSLRTHATLRSKAAQYLRQHQQYEFIFSKRHSARSTALRAE